MVAWCQWLPYTGGRGDVAGSRDVPRRQWPYGAASRRRRRVSVGGSGRSWASLSSMHLYTRQVVDVMFDVPRAVAICGADDGHHRGVAVGSRRCRCGTAVGCRRVSSSLSCLCMRQVHRWSRSWLWPCFCGMQIVVLILAVFGGVVWRRRRQY